MITNTAEVFKVVREICEPLYANILENLNKRDGFLDFKIKTVRIIFQDKKAEEGERGNRRGGWGEEEGEGRDGGQPKVGSE